MSIMIEQENGGRNEYVFERRAIVIEESVVYANTIEEAWDRVDNFDVDEMTQSEFVEYYDDEYKLVDEKINDPLVDMVVMYGKPYQFELFEITDPIFPVITEGGNG